MPSAAVDFRPVCGQFVPLFMNFMLKRAIEKKAARISILKLKRRADGVALGLLLSYLFWGSLLMQCGDVDSNPGPPKLIGTTTRQSRIASAGGLENPASPSSQNPKEPSLTQVMERIDGRFDTVTVEIRAIREDYAVIQDEMRGMRDEMVTLRQENKDLKALNQSLGERMENLERKTDDLEGRSKRNNLILYGFARTDNETKEELEAKVQELFTDRLEMSDEVKFDRVHRLNAKPDSPAIMRCVFYKQKLEILKAKNKLKGTNYFIGEDFSRRVRDIRRRLTPHLKTARGDNKRATMVFDHLLIDGKRYGVTDADTLVELK